MDYPKLRSVEAFPAEADGKRLIGLRDPMRLSDKMVILPQPAFFIVSHFDGKHSFSDIKLAYTRQFSAILLQSDIDKIVADLDAAYFLESENFQTYYQQLVREFKEKPYREATHSGSAYPNQRHGVQSLVNEIVEKTPEDAAAGNPSANGKKLKALISPHIDYFRGGQCYGYAYKRLKQNPGHKLFIIFGTSHYGGKNHFIFTKKDYDTPLGRLKTNAKFIEKLETMLDMDLCEEEFLHRNEHSIELQAVFLKALFPSEDISIVPVLCGSFYEMTEEGKKPDDDEEIKKVIGAMKKLLREEQQETMVIAAADLSHVGLMFGDKNPVTPGALDGLREKDLETLKYAGDILPKKFFDDVAKDLSERKICGTAPIYYTLLFAEGCEGKLLNYDQWYGMEQGSTVTFASMAFYI